MRICFIIPGFGDGGAQKQGILLLNELQTRAGLDLHLIRFHPGEVHDGLLRTERLAVHTIPARSNWNPANIFRAWRLVRRLRPHILVSWLPACDIYAFAIRKLLPHIRWVMTERDSFYPPDLRFLLRRFAGRHADLIVSNSRAGDALWQRWAPQVPRHLVGNIVPKVLLAARGQPKRFDVIHVGRLEPQKNVLVVAQAFALLARRRPELRFAFVGKGSLQTEVAKIIQEGGVADRFELAGFRRDVQSFIRESRVVVTMSNHEGTPNVMLEAVAENRPVLASAIPEHIDVLGPDYPHLIRERHDPELVATGIEAILGDPEATDHLESARERLTGMAAQQIGDAYFAIFSGLLRVTA